MWNWKKNSIEKNFFTSCKVKIGYGDHEFNALIDLYKMNSDSYDFAKIRFISDSSWFYGIDDNDNKFHRIYMDNEYNSYKGEMEVEEQDLTINRYIGEMKAGQQVLKINRLSFCMPSEDNSGRITMSFDITNKFGKNNKKGFKYDLLQWNRNYIIKDKKEKKDEPVTITKPIGANEDIIVKITLMKSGRGNEYNKAAIQFIYKPDDEKFFYCSGDEGCGDTVYLFEQSFCIHNKFTMCINCFDCKDSSNIRLIIDELKLKLATYNEYGEIYLDAEYKNGDTSEEIEVLLASWKLNGDEC